MPGPLQLAVDPVDPDDRGLVTLLAGPAGSGRTTTLAGLAEQARRRGRAVLELAPDPAEQATPWVFLARLARQAADRAAAGPEVLPAGHPEALVRAVVRLLRRLDDPLVLIDDGQWIDAESLRALPALLHGLAGSRVRCVAAVRVPVAGARHPASWLGRLRRAGLLTVRSLPPLDPVALDDLLTGVLEVPPHPALRDAVGRASAGRPGPALAALDGYRARGAVRIVAGRAYLLDLDGPPAPPADHSLLASLRQAPEPVWAVGVAMAWLHPLGPDARAVAAEALDLSPAAVTQAVQELVRIGVLRGGGRGFASPVTATALQAAGGPYLSRRLAQAAVTAVWRGSARCEDPGAVAELLVRAGRSVDAERAADELLWLADRMPATDGRTLRWRAVASELVAAPESRVAALLGLAAAASHLGDHDRARRAAQAAFDEAETPGLRAEAQLLLLRSGGQEPSTADGSPVVAAAALSMMDRWVEAADRLNAPEPYRAGGRPAAWVPLRERTSAVVGPWHPVSTEAPVVPADSLHRDRLVQRVGIRLVVGDVSGAQHLMRCSGWTEADLPWPERALLAWRLGAWSVALDHAAMADLAASPVPPLDAVLSRARATMTLARGYPLRAREFVASSAAGVGLPHLRSLTEAEISMYIGATDTAITGLHRAADEAARAGVSIGTDEIWLRLTELAWAQQDMARTREYAARAVRAAQSVGTAVSHLYAGLARLAVDPEPGRAVQETLDLARELGQPWLLATTLERVATWRAGPPELLAQAYEQFGALDALLDRARLRTTMRAYGVTVPNRAATAAENERLLAQLVADGLSGPELAATLRTTGKSIESRLGRLFARTGYRSRAALAAAVANTDRRVVG